MAHTGTFTVKVNNQYGMLTVWLVKPNVHSVDNSNKKYMFLFFRDILLSWRLLSPAGRSGPCPRFSSFYCLYPRTSIDTSYPFPKHTQEEACRPIHVINKHRHTQTDTLLGAGLYLQVLGCDVVVLTLDLFECSREVRQGESTLSLGMSRIDLLQQLLDFLWRINFW